MLLIILTQVYACVTAVQMNQPRPEHTLDTECQLDDEKGSFQQPVLNVRKIKFSLLPNFIKFVDLGCTIQLQFCETPALY